MLSDKLRLSQYTIVASLVLLIALFSALHIHWLNADTLVGPEVDEKVYFVRTAGFLATLSSGGWNSLGEALQSLDLSGRPPLYQLLSVPFILIFGLDMDSAVLVNLLFQALLVIAVYQIGKLVSSAKTGLLAALLVSVYPPLVQLARIYRPHFAMAACVGLGLWSLLALIKNRSVKNVRLFALALTFGLFIHPTVAFSLWLPALAGLVYGVFFQVAPRWPKGGGNTIAWIKTKLSDPVFLRGYLPAFLLAAALVGGWYLSSGTALLNALETISSEDLGDFRGYEVFTKGLRLDGVSYFWWYAATMPKAISWIFTGFFGIGLGYAVWVRKPAILLLVATYLGAYLAFANLTTMTWLHFAQVLPVAALVSVAWMEDIKVKWLRSGLTVFLIAASAFVYAFVNWDLPGLNPVAVALGAPLNPKGACQSNDQVFCPYPPSREDWKIPEIIETIVDDADCQPDHCTLLVLKSSGFDFSVSSFSYYKSVEYSQSPLEMASIGGVAFSISPFNFDAFLNSGFIIYMDAKNPGQSYYGAAIKTVKNPPESFASTHMEVAAYNLPDGRKARLLKRIAPLTLAEAQDVIQAIELDEKYKFGQYRALAPLYFLVNNLNEALEAYQKALEYEPDDASLYFGLAGVYADLKKPGQSASAYQQVIALAPGTDLALQAQAWLDAHSK